MRTLLGLPVLRIQSLSSPSQLFVCRHLQATASILSAGSCVARQHRPAAQPGRRQGKSLSPCHNGCLDGAKIRARVGEVEIVDRPWAQIHAARHKSQKRMLDVPCLYCTKRMRRPDRATCGYPECAAKARVANPKRPAVRVRVEKKPPPPRVYPCVCICGNQALTPECCACRARRTKKEVRAAAGKRALRQPLNIVSDDQIRADYKALGSITSVAKKYRATFRSTRRRLRGLGLTTEENKATNGIAVVGKHIGLNRETALAALKSHGRLNLAARALGVDPKTVKYWARKPYNVPWAASSLTTPDVQMEHDRVNRHGASTHGPAAKARNPIANRQEASK